LKKGSNEAELKHVKSGRSTRLDKDDMPLALLNQSADDARHDFESNDQLQTEEPLVIRLMASMFTKKHSVRERLQMIPAISLEKLRKELNTLKLKDKVKCDNEQRE
jgi:uncharacterized protein HemY